jgi:hypothetical protein
MTKPFSKAELAANAGSGKTLVIDLRKLTALDPDRDKQAKLRRFLIEEEDKLASNREELENSARRVREGKQRIERLRKIKAAHDNLDDHGLARVKALTQRLMENFHRRLHEEYPFSVKLQETIVGVCATLEEARRRAQEFARANSEAVVTIVDARHGRSEIFHQGHC